MIRAPSAWLVLIGLLAQASAWAQDTGSVPGHTPGLEAAMAQARQRLTEALDAAGRAAQSGTRLRSLPEVDTLPGPRTGIDPAHIAERYAVKAEPAAAQPALYVLVSFSVPEASLKRIAQDAARAGAVMILRGLKAGSAPLSLGATMEALRPLADSGASVQVHPQLFERFGIDAVPAFVLTTGEAERCDEEARACAPHFAAAGDVPLRYALEHLARHSATAAGLAQPFLARLPEVQ